MANIERQLNRRDLLRAAAFVGAARVLGSETVEAAFGPNIERNSSFNEREISITPTDIWKPKFWKKVVAADALEDYVQNSKARSGGRCVKVRVFNRVDKRQLFSGAWESEDPIKVDTTKTYSASFFAKFEKFGDLHEKVNPRMTVLALNKQGEVLKSITFAPRAASVGNWEKYGFNFGKNTPREFPAGTYAILRRFDAVGISDVGHSDLTTYRGDVFFDDVSLRKSQ